MLCHSFLGRQVKSVNITIFSFYELTPMFFFCTFLSYTFAGVTYSKKNLALLFLFSSVFFGITVAVSLSTSPATGWALLPLTAHLPILLLLYFYYHKQFMTALVSICTAYLFCQPSKWLFSLFQPFLNEQLLIQIISFTVLMVLIFAGVMYYSPLIVKIYKKDFRSVLIFGSLPIIYYITNIFFEMYTSTEQITVPMITEVYRFLLCIAYLLFYIIYYDQYEEKLEQEKKDQLVHVTVEQQKRKLETIRQTEQEIHVLRHDMHLFLNTLITYIQKDHKDAALQLASSLASNIDSTPLPHFSNSDVINYVLSDFASKFERNQIEFQTTIELDSLKVDEILFASILSNALDNALHATCLVDEKKRYVRLMLKFADNQLFLTVRNPIQTTPVFTDGRPVSQSSEHGYGVKSICCMTEQLGGKYTFSVDQRGFLLRIII